MNTRFKITLLTIGLVVFGLYADAQGIKLGKVLLISGPVKKDLKSGDFEACMKSIIPSWNKKNPAEVQWFLADRGNRKGEKVLVCAAVRSEDREALGTSSPFAGKLFSGAGLSCKPAELLNSPEAYTEYHLIGADHFKSAPVMGILGIHYIQVKKERSEEFEKFVIDKLHPSVGNLFPDLKLLYYKAVAGENVGSYITIFALESAAARDKYWPGGKDADILKTTFKPLQGLAKELGPYLVEGSFLEPSSGGAAAYFESRQWTDFVIQ